MYSKAKNTDNTVIIINNLNTATKTLLLNDKIESETNIGNTSKQLETQLEYGTSINDMHFLYMCFHHTEYTPLFISNTSSCLKF